MLYCYLEWYPVWGYLVIHSCPSWLLNKILGLELELMRAAHLLFNSLHWLRLLGYWADIYIIQDLYLLDITSNMLSHLKRICIQLNILFLESLGINPCDWAAHLSCFVTLTLGICTSRLVLNLAFNNISREIGWVVSRQSLSLGVFCTSDRTLISSTRFLSSLIINTNKLSRTSYLA